ncbi:MAG: translocation/assembly module TamB domain-containing protein [Thermoanaerobaculia bacterium]
MTQNSDRPGSPEPIETPLQKQRRRPMWGCVRTLFLLLAGTIAIIALFFVGTYYYLGTTNFAEFVRLRVERNLESHLGRDVTIARVTIDRRYPTRIVIDDLRVANAPGATRPYFATVRQIEIVGGLDSFWQRVIRLGRVDVRDARINFEVFPEGSELMHNFPKWKRSAPRRYEITRLEISKMFVTGTSFEFNDRRHDVYALTSGLAAEVTPKFRKSIYEGFANNGSVMLRIQDYQPVTLDLRGGFYYRPGSLSLRSVALRGRGLEAFVSGMVDPLTDAVYDLRVVARADLERIREVFRVENRLAGRLSLDGRLQGKQGDFTLGADFVVPKLAADAYDLTEMRGRMTVTEEDTKVLVKSARYGGGTISADYHLTQYAEPYPMNVELRYNGVSIEKLFEDWELPETGLRGGARGKLTYAWNKDDILAGKGEGTAKLLPGAIAFGNARYPIRIGGDTRFRLDRGTVYFAPSKLATPSSDVAFSGSLKIEGVVADLALTIDSRDFAELDQVAFNFARATGEKDFEILGFGGSGQIRGTVKGPFDEPMVVATVTGSQVAFNNVTLGDADIALRYNGPAAVLTFDRGLFRAGDATLAMTGTITFPESGPSPRYDLAFDAAGWDVARAIELVELDLVIAGAGTGRLRVTGTPESGTVVFEPLQIVKNGSRLRLDGTVNWAPGEGNVTFDLNLAAESYLMQEILAFLEMTKVQATGGVTGTLHLEGHKSRLEGAGSMTLRDGTLFGERIDEATADLVFKQGTLEVPHLEARGPSGTVSGEATVDLNTERFSYIIRSATIDPLKVGALAALSKMLGGKLTITSSGSGTFDQPEIVLEARLDDATVRGLELPDDVPPPQLFLSIRDGRLTVRGSAFDAASIEGSGSVSPEGAVDGLVQITVSDFARLLTYLNAESSVPLTGNSTIDLRLGGRINPIDALTVEGNVPVLNIAVSGQPLTAPKPIRFGFRDGRVVFDEFEIAGVDSSFRIEGSVGVTDTRPIDLRVRGTLEAGLLQLFVPDVRAEGHVRLDAGITGTLTAPRLNGSAEIIDAEVRLAGFPQSIDDIRASFILRGEEIEIDSFSATLGGGTITAGGSIILAGLAPSRLRLSIQGSNVVIRYFEGLTLEGSFGVLLSGDLEHSVLAGELNLTRGLYYKDFDFATSVLNLLLERRTIVPEVAAPWQETVALDVAINAKDALAIKNNMADVTASAELSLRGSLANPIFIGLVTIDEGGIVRLQDVEYRVTRGTIDFQNPFRLDPYFDITAEGRRGEYELTVNLTGTLDRIEPSITSDPPASDLTLLSLFTADFDPTQGTGMQPTELQTAGAALLIQSVGGLIGSRILPFADAVRIDPGLADETGPSVTFEKQISNSVRAIVIYNTTNQHNKEIVEWQVTPEWFITFTRDDETGETVFINAVEARFRRRYEGHW